MEKEILACIEKDKIKFLHSGQISKYVFPMLRFEAHKKGIPHLIVRVFILTRTPEGNILFLVQKRGKNKKSYPEYFTDSASGHILYKKDLNLVNIRNEAFRELEEEFGINLKDILKLNFYDLKVENDKFSTEIAYIFIGVVKYNIDLKPNPKELEINDSKFYTRSKLVGLIKEDNVIDYSKEIWNEILNSDIDSLFEYENRTDEIEENNIALYIGRFQPLHHGHIHVIYKIFEKTLLFHQEFHELLSFERY